MTTPDVVPVSGPRPPARGRGRAQAAVAAGLLAAALVAVFWPATACDFVGFDDLVYTRYNPVVRDGLSWKAVAGALGSVRDYWTPLTEISFAADVSLFGMGPRGFHVTNVLLHALNAALLFLLLRRLTGRTGRSLAAALLFAAHPLRVEPVAWITGRKDLLAALFGLIALAAWLRWTGTLRLRWRLASFLSFAASLAAKPALVTFPLLLLVLDFWPLGRLASPVRSRAVARLMREKLPFFGLALVFGALMLRAQTASLHPILGLESVAFRLQRGFSSAFIYARKTLWPADLTVEFTKANEPVRVGVLAAAAAGVALLTWLAVLARRRRPYLLAGWGWYFLALLPAAGFIGTGKQWIADRFTYVPHVGLAVALVWAAAGLRTRLPRARTAGLLATAALALGLAVVSRVQVKHWRNGIVLFERAVAFTPGEAFAESSLADTLAREGRAEEALPHFRTALAAYPDYADGRRWYGLALAAVGRVAEAVGELETAARLDPGKPEPLHDLGELFARVGRPAEAAAWLERYVSLETDREKRAAGWYRLAGVQRQLQRPAEAIVNYRRALFDDPGLLDARYDLAVTLVDSGHRDEGMSTYREVLRLNPGDLEARLNLAELLYRAGRLDEARREFTAVATAVPGTAEEAFAAGRLHDIAGEPGPARESYGQVGQRKPALPGSVERLREAIAGR